MVEQSQFDKAISLADEIGGSKELTLYSAGRLAALQWYCRYALDDAIEADEISQHVAKETRPDFLAGFGIQLWEIGTLHLAEPVLERLTVVAPDDERSWYNYGCLLSEREQWDLAVEALERTKKLDPSHALCHWALGTCYREIDEPQAAAAAYQAFLRLKPDDIDALVLGGIAHSDAGQYDEAATMLEKAISVDPDCISAYYNLAVVASQTEDRGRLQDLQEQVARIAPDDWRSDFLDALLHELRGEYWDSWVCRKDAFSITAEAENWESLDTIIASTLYFALEHGFDDYAGPWIDAVFRYHCVSKAVLRRLRELTEPRLEQASCLRILVEGTIPAADLSQEDGERSGDELLGYVWAVCVFAETEEKARDIAIDFDRRLGRQPVSIERVENLGEARDVHQGVYWCEQAIHSFPLGEDQNEGA